MTELSKYQIEDQLREDLKRVHQIARCLQILTDHALEVLDLDITTINAIEGYIDSLKDHAHLIIEQTVTISLKD